MCCSLGQISRRQGCHVWSGREWVLAGAANPDPISDAALAALMVDTKDRVIVM